MRMLDRLFGKKGQVTTIQEFVTKAVKGPSSLHTKISEFATLPFALADGLHKRGLADSDVNDLVDRALVGICPECGTPYTGGWLSHVATLKESGLVSKAYGQSSASVRFLEGECKNPNCSCKEIVILWGPRASSPIHIFITALRDESAEVRKAVANALGEIPDGQDGSYPSFVQKVVPDLTRALKDESEGVREAAKTALKKIEAKKIKV